MTFPLTGVVRASLRRLREAEAEEGRDRELNVQLCLLCGDETHNDGPFALSAAEIIAFQLSTFVRSVGFIDCSYCRNSVPSSELLHPPKSQRQFLEHHASDLRLYILAGHHKRA